MNYETQITKHLDIVEPVNPKWLPNSTAALWRKYVIKTAKMIDEGKTVEEIRQMSEKMTDDNKIDAIVFVIEWIEGRIDKQGQEEPKVEQKPDAPQMDKQTTDAINQIVEAIADEIPMTHIQVTRVFKLMGMLQRQNLDKMALEINNIVKRYQVPGHDLIDQGAIAEIKRVAGIA